MDETRCSGNMWVASWHVADIRQPGGQYECAVMQFNPLLHAAETSSCKGKEITGMDQVLINGFQLPFNEKLRLKMLFSLLVLALF